MFPAGALRRARKGLGAVLAGLVVLAFGRLLGWFYAVSDWTEAVEDGP